MPSQPVLKRCKMAKITKSSVLNKLSDLTGIQTAIDELPSQLNTTISPVININPSFTLLVRSNASTTTAATTAYTTPSDKDFYLTYLYMSNVKDAACDNTAVYLNVDVPDGGTQRIASFENIPSVATSKEIAINFTYPIKLRRNSIMSLVGTFTAGTMTKRILIGGFLLD